jgi:5-methylcytosine-specific restriction endonuclease McrA
MESVLVLDVSYRPMTCASWETAIVWVLEKVVEVVDEYPDRYIRTPNWKVNMPSVVRMLRSVPRRRGVKFSRQNVYARDRGRCQYCGERVPRSEYTYDHVVPRSLGGRTSWENVVVACVPCNQRKGGRTPAQAKMFPHSLPVKPKRLPDMPGLSMTWQPHMPAAWQDWLRSAVYWGGELEEDK